MTPDKRRAKALSILREGRLTVLGSETAETSMTPHRVLARVAGHRGVHAVDFDGTWSCTCPDPKPCPHITAAQLVTDHYRSAS